MIAATVTHRRWLRHVKFVFEQTVISKVGISDLSCIPISIKSHGVRSRDLGGQGIGPAPSVMPFAPETSFSFDNDRSATSRRYVKIKRERDSVVG
jgi:hypothetical protein